MQLMAEDRVTRIGPGIQSCGGGALNLSHLEPIDCPLPNLQIFLACVISGIDLIFHSFYRDVVLTSWVYRARPRSASATASGSSANASLSAASTDRARSMSSAPSHLATTMVATPLPIRLVMA